MPRPRTGETRPCLTCGRDIYLAPSTLRTRKTCSAACRQVFLTKARDTTCAACGLVFQQPPSVRKRFCSRPCYESTRRPDKTCLICGGPVRKSAMNYCSYPCSVEGKRTSVIRACAGCGKELRIQPHALRERSACSTACAGKVKRLTGAGARFRRSDGYVTVYYPTHPDASAGGWIMEHRLVMEQHLGRRLLKTEQVNHINHVRHDNRVENLEILTPGDHARESNAFGKRKRQTMRDRLAAYEAKYGPLME